MQLRLVSFLLWLQGGRNLFESETLSFFPFVPPDKMTKLIVLSAPLTASKRAPTPSLPPAPPSPRSCWVDVREKTSWLIHFVISPAIFRSHLSAFYLPLHPVPLVYFRRPTLKRSESILTGRTAVRPPAWRKSKFQIAAHDSPSAACLCVCERKSVCVCVLPAGSSRL